MLMLKNVRLSFPSLFTASAFNGEGDAKYSAIFLIEKGSESAKQIEAEIKRVAIAQWGDKAKAVLARQDADGNRQLLKDGDGPKGMTQDGEPKNGYAGHLFIKASSKQPPKVVGRQRQPITEESGIIYAGCMVNAQIDIWAQANKFGNFLNCKLLAVQYWADGERFGAAGADVNAFDTAEDDVPFETADTGDGW